MRYIVFSDVHSNLEAFEAVLDVFKKSNIDNYIFLGDIVGYGANPRECIAALKDLKGTSQGTGAICIAGNHDWAVLGLTETDFFNERAKQAVFWTRDHISESDRMYLRDMELVTDLKGNCLVHGTLDHPEEFHYMIDGYQAKKSFSLLRGRICFVGHSHCPGVFIEGEGGLSYEEPEVLVLEEKKRYIVNDGSVGQPRDGDPRACFCIYDDEANTIEFRRLSYDVASAQKKIIDAGLPKSLADRLSIGL